MANKFMKYKKKSLIFASILIVVGLVISLIGFGMLDFNINKLSPNYIEYTQTEKFYEIDKDKPLNLSIDINSSDIDIQPSNDNTVKLFFSPEYFNVELNTDSPAHNSLNIMRNENYHSNKKWYYLINISSDAPYYDKLTLEIPEKFLGDLSVKLNHGELNINGISHINNFYIDSKSADINLSNLQILEDTTITSSHGNLSIFNSNIEKKCLINGSSGNLQLNNNYICNSEIFLTHGENKITNLEGNTLYMETSSGNINLKDVMMKTSLDVNSKHGEIFLNSIDASLIKLESNSGSIRGNINNFEEAYKINSYSKSGTNNLHSKFTGEKELIVESKYGDINIKFKK